jgi:beta-galactosidase
VIYGSETSSIVQSRGIYHFPLSAGRLSDDDGQCSSLGNSTTSWGAQSIEACVVIDRDLPYSMGQFLWSGFDYLGEPTPYDEYWPSRSSYFGICDLAGLPKDRYYLYRSRWNKNQHTIHLLPHWSWGQARKGKVTPVYCYTDYPSGELFINGKSQGKVTKNPKERLDRYRLRWNDVKYEPGELKVVVYDANGNAAGEEIVKTAGKPADLKLEAWTANENLQANGDDLAFVTVSLTDAEGTLIPQADDQLTFEVTGAGTFEAVCNGDATSLESFKQPTMKLFSGQLVVVVRSAQKAGTLTLKVSDAKRKLSKTIDIAVR